MKELSWRERGQLWLRLGLRLLLWIIGLWALVRLGPPLVSLFAPFLLAFFVAWGLSPLVRWLYAKFRLPRRASTLGLLLLVFVALGALVWALVSAAAGEIAALALNWEGLLASLQTLTEDLGTRFSRGMELLPGSLRTAVETLTQQLFQWLKTVIPTFLSTGMDYAANVARRLPSFAVASVVFIMASYFFTADFPRLRSMVADKLPKESRALFAQIKRAASAGFGGYIRSQLILSVGVFFILMGGLLLVRQPYFLLLALALAVLDFIPILGSGTVMVPWAVIDLVLGDYRHALGLMAVWGLVALFRRVAEPKILGDQTGLPPLLSLASVYVGMKLAGVAGMILGPVLCLVALNLCRSGVLDRSLADLRLAGRDISAILRSGDPEPEESEKKE